MKIKDIKNKIKELKTISDSMKESAHNYDKRNLRYIAIARHQKAIGILIAISEIEKVLEKD